MRADVEELAVRVWAAVELETDFLGRLEAADVPMVFADSRAAAVGLLSLSERVLMGGETKEGARPFEMKDERLRAESMRRLSPQRRKSSPPR